LSDAGIVFSALEALPAKIKVLSRMLKEEAIHSSYFYLTMHIIALAARWHLKKRHFSIDAIFVSIEVLGCRTKYGE